MNIVIIPARGGSKRIPRKNLRSFCGKPMIVRSIEAAKESGLFDKILVSTDDEEIAELANRSGAWVPFIRPEELADDYATTREVINHALTWLRSNDHKIEFCCCLYATAPFVKPEYLIEAYEQLLDSDSSFCFSATTFSFPIQRAFYFDDTGSIEMFDESKLRVRSQDLVEAYHDAGQFYWGKPEAFLNDLAMFSSHSSAYILPRYRVQDIDTEEDWKTAELVFRALESQEGD